MSLIAIAFCVVPSESFAIERCGLLPEGVRLSDPFQPPMSSGPVLVGMGIHIEDLAHIDPIRGSFDFEGAIEVRWCDPRLAFDPEEAGMTRRCFFGPNSNRERQRI